MDIRYISFVVAVFATIPAMAQIDPTVEVTNDYERSLSVTKPTMDMAVPDSLLSFDLDFDYSVFSNPYRGGYDFSPYLMDMKPMANDYFGGKFYLRAGAGYSLHPTVDLAWLPVSSEKFSLNVYGRHRSYFGDYRNVSSISGSSAKFSGSWTGHEMDTRLGLDGRVEWKKGTFYFGVDGSGIGGESKWAEDDFYRGGGRLGIRSNDKVSSKFYYDLSADFHYGKETLGSGSAYGYEGSQGYTDFGVHGTVGPTLGKDGRLLIGAGVESSSFGDGSVLDGYINPRYVMDKGPLSLSLGLRIGYVYSTMEVTYGAATKASFEDAIENVEDSYDHGQMVYPDVSVNYEAIAGRLSLYAVVTGGERVNSFSSLKSARHFFNRGMVGSDSENCGSSYEDYDASVGVRGNISGRFRFDVKAGYASWNNGMLDGVELMRVDDGGGAEPCPVLTFADYDQFYASARFALDTKRVSADGHFRFTATDAYDDGAQGFAEAPFSGDLRVRYNWRERIYVGAGAAFASSRKGIVAGLSGGETGWLPSYLDLGLSAEYALTGKLSLWAEGGNLLGSKVMLSPLCCEKGAYVTAGVTLHL